MANEISNTEDLLDVRDIIERVEELDAIHDELYDAAHDDDFSPDILAENKARYDAWVAEDGGESSERATLHSLLDELKGGGDEQWKGDWYAGIPLIHENYFTDYVEELLKDCGELPRELPSYIAIDWEKTADNVRVDYTDVDFDGQTYLTRF